MSTHVHPPHEPFVGPDGRPERPALATAIAIVDLVVGIPLALLGVGLSVGGLLPGSIEDRAALLAFGGVFLVIGLLGVAAAIGLLKLEPWGRVLQFIVSGISLLYCGIGTIVGALIIAYFLQRKVALAYSGRRVEEMHEQERQAIVQNRGGSGAVVAIVVGISAFFVVFVAITGIMAAIAIPNMVSGIQRGKQKRTMGDIRTVATALEARATDTNEYPPVTRAEDLVPLLVPTYATELPIVDSWGQPFEVATTPRSYLLRSSGKDKRFEVPLADAETSAAGSTTDYERDIVFANGSFVQYPDGVQQ